MPRRTNDFQRLIAAIEAQLAPLGAVVTESKLVKEIHSDTEREIDIAIESTVGQHAVMIAIECRDHSRPADIEWIDALIGKYRNLRVQKIVAVSRSGFSKAAIQKATQVNISTITLEDAIEAKCIPSNQKRELPIEMLRPGPPDIDIVLSRDDVEKYGPYVGNIKTTDVFDCQGGFLGVVTNILKSHADKVHIDSAMKNLIKYEEGPLPPITVSFPNGTKVVGANGVYYQLRRAEIRRDAQLKMWNLQLRAFRYFDVELLTGDIEMGEGKVRLLLLYKGDDERHIIFEFEAKQGFIDPIVANLIFCPNGRE